MRVVLQVLLIIRLDGPGHSRTPNVHELLLRLDRELVNVTSKGRNNGRATETLCYSQIYRVQRAVAKVDYFEAIDAQRQRQPMSYRPLYGELE